MLLTAGLISCLRDSDAGPVVELRTIAYSDVAGELFTHSRINDEGNDPRIQALPGLQKDPYLYHNFRSNYKSSSSQPIYDPVARASTQSLSKVKSQI